MPEAILFPVPDQESTVCSMAEPVDVETSFLWLWHVRRTYALNCVRRRGGEIHPDLVLVSTWSAKGQQADQPRRCTSLGPLGASLGPASSSIRKVVT